MSAPDRGRPLVGAVLLIALVASAIACWQVLDGSPRAAGGATLVASVAVVCSSMLARGSRWTFLDVIAYRVFDAAILGAIAWVARPVDASLALAALLALAGGFLASYFVARGRALGYSIWGSTVNRAVRCGLLTGALLVDDPAAWLWTLAVLSGLTALIRASQAFKEARV